MNPLFKKVTSSFEERKEAVCFRFQQICEQAMLPSLFCGFSKWAIVGGAVRDLLLEDTLDESNPLFELPDIDIAVDRPLSKNYFDGIPPTFGNEIKINFNSFGGLKLTSRKTGVVDAWSWEPRRSAFLPSKVLTRLGQVDFGINAVAYLWPDNELIIHPRWFEDLEKLVVEKLAPSSQHPEYQPIRACAVAAKLTKNTKTEFRLGSAIRGEMHSCFAGDKAALNKAMDYLHRKIEMKRWSVATKERFQNEWARYASGEEKRPRNTVDKQAVPALQQEPRHNVRFTQLSLA